MARSKWNAALCWHSAESAICAPRIGCAICWNAARPASELPPPEHWPNRLEVSTKRRAGKAETGCPRRGQVPLDDPALEVVAEAAGSLGALPAFRGRALCWLSLLRHPSSGSQANGRPGFGYVWPTGSIRRFNSSKL